MFLMKKMRWILPALMLSFVPAIAPAQISITVTTAPPPLPMYEQPPCPEEGWMWSPGYWAWSDDEGYYWVPGTWVPAPYTGAMWTPPWWGWDSGRYRFHEGYWGDDVGYYGGIDYGYGYMGEGFAGGQWRGGRFAYNTAIMRVNPTVVHYTYVDENVVRTRTIPNERHIAYNGGPNGIRHDPTPIERRGMTGRHTALTPVQQQQIQAARADRLNYARANNGHPHTLAVTRPSGAVQRQGSDRVNRNENDGRREPGRQGVAPVPSRNETRPVQGRAMPENRTEPNRRPESQARPAERQRNETRPGTLPRNEARPAPEQRNEARPDRPAPRPRMESRPTPPIERPRSESRPVQPAERPRPESRRAPAPHESRPGPVPRAEPQHETRPAPQPHAEQRSAPEGRPAQHELRGGSAHSEPHAAPAHAQREGHAAAPPRQEKPKSE